MKTQLRIFALAILLSLLAFPNPEAIAHPFQLVVYDDVEMSAVAFSIQADAKGIDHIMVYHCPKNSWIKDVSQCGKPTESMKTSEFPGFVKSSVLSWGYENTGKALKEISPEDMAAYVSIDRANNDPAIRDKIVQLQALRDDLQGTLKMLQHLPDSIGYQTHAKELQDKIKPLELATNQSSVNIAKSAAVQRDLENYAATMLKLISGNDAKTGEPNNFARTLMKNTLLDVVMHELSITMGGSNFHFNGHTYSFYIDSTTNHSFSTIDGQSQQLWYSPSTSVPVAIMGNSLLFCIVLDDSGDGIIFIYDSLANRHAYNLFYANDQIASLDSVKRIGHKIIYTVTNKSGKSLQSSFDDDPQGFSGTPQWTPTP